MANHNLYPPYFHVNEEFKKNVSNTEFDDESKELYIKEIVKDADSMGTFLSHHKMPCYQGHLMNPIGLNTLGQSFSSFTTFKHPDNVSCGTWTAENPSGGGLRKHTKVVDKDIDDTIHLAGPGSKLYFSIIYTCQLGECKIGCACIICITPRICKRGSCGETPYDECNLQCVKHKICLSRTFDEHEDLFTLVVGIKDSSNESKLMDAKEFILKKCPNIPRDCQVCASDLEDNALTRCRFCRKDTRFIDFSLSAKHRRQKRIDFETQDKETCNSCFKTFATKYVKGKNDQEAHNERQFKCIFCSRMFQSKTSLEYHTETYHDPSMPTFKCPVCEQILSTKSILKRHIQTVHENPTFESEKCGEKLSRKNHYNRHLREAYSIEHKLNMHYASPEILYKFKCDHCEEKFNRNETLKRHVKTIHGDDVYESEEYKCKFCMKTFNRNDNKRRHEASCPKNKD